ncbi:ATP-binding cassette subfamily B protein [Ruminiclostridium sufflavum DSM 19573]|uniref:ATP-binding cassette subfamily B protein n=1 Tax=Ruminiclostridium sufflavum DSM 19573 TaxID=1121337 RepID=A0A318Y8R7_9FIRM|nr:ABC transporter ATP-binding protein [Ruminiclostridium sufflavum]PYG88708.1 ATP-binding cassette subfamily B protein [Ruminiclostridium sufflavum DSM 19573]
MFKKVLNYTGEYRKTTYAAIVLMLVSIVMNALPFWFIYQIITPLLMRETMSLHYVALRVAAIAVCVVLYAIFYVRGLSLSHESAYNTLKNLRISLQERLEQQPLGVIQGKGIGSVKKVFIDDIETIELLLAHALPEGIANLAIPVMVFAGMFIADWKLALLALCSLPVGIFSMLLMYRIGMKEMGNYYGAAQKMNNTIVEYINGMEVVKVFNRDGESYHRFEGDVKNYRDFTLAWYKACWPWMALYSSVLPTVSLFVLPIGAYLVIHGYSTLPDLALVLCMSFGIGAPLLRALGFMSTLPQINFKIASLEKIMSASPLQQTDKPFMGKDHSVEFDSLSFSYKDTEVLHGISLKVPEGSMTALVGESGSGKSTLAKLLVHFYDIDSGSVKIGGQELRDMSIEALNNEISYVAQEQFLFNISLLENIRLGRLDATDDEVMAAAEKAQCGEFLSRLENGIHTLAGDGGKQLSGGERQRISLARAILKNAPIIVLDEATAFMDPENEEKMNEAIAEVIREKTVIVIAHRLHSIINADQICVLKEGNLAAAGTHKELLDTCPEYQKLWQAAKASANWKVSIAKGDEN